jgi:hypothetical protein
MENTQVITVSFIGGPYDGCIRTVPQRTLCGEIEMPVSQNVLRILTGDPVGEAAPIRLVARYRLLLSGNGCRFRFHGFRRVSRDEERSLAGWHRAMLAVWKAATATGRQS